jgi:hypothetical protein
VRLNGSSCGPMSDPVFSPEALDDNRRGALSPAQRDQFQVEMNHKHRGLMGRVGQRIDPWASDVEAGRVDMIEGAVSKRVKSAAGFAYEIHVATRQTGDDVFGCPQDLYQAAPGIGMIRLFYLPRSRWAVNFERLPDATVNDTSAQAAGETVLDWGLSRLQSDAGAAAEARAHLAAIGNEISRQLPHDVPASFVSSDPGSLAATILGEWTSPLLSVRFAPDGRLSVQIGGEAHDGTWSLDSDGRLHSDVMDPPIVADASVVGGELTLIINGQALTMRRPPAS